MIDLTLCRRVEEASLNAWPALQQSLIDGWVLRFSRGFTKRANSIVPLYPSQQGAIEKIRYCENLYSRERLKTIFRLTTVMEAESLDALLEQRGYQHVDPTRVLVRDLQCASFSVDPSFHEVPRDEWLDAYAGAADVPPAGQQLHAMLLAGIRSEHVFGFISLNQVPVACGIAVLERELVGLFDVVTLPSARRQGHAQCAGRIAARMGSEQRRSPRVPASDGGESARSRAVSARSASTICIGTGIASHPEW